MTDFIDQDLSGARFERAKLTDASFRGVDFSGADVRGALLRKVRMRGVELIDVDIHGELVKVVINGVDVVPLVEAELNRRMPERAWMRPITPEGFQRAWRTLEHLWAGTVERAQSLAAHHGDDVLHASVDEEWSFIQTLRHLNFASAAWVGRMVLGFSRPWHPLDLPWDEAPHWENIPWDREARPSLDEVLAVRKERQAMVRGVIEGLTERQLASTVSHLEPGWPHLKDFPLKECLLIVLNEEWEHRLYAERDLTALEYLAPAIDGESPWENEEGLRGN